MSGVGPRNIRIEPQITRQDIKLIELDEGLLEQLEDQG